MRPWIRGYPLSWIFRTRKDDLATKQLFDTKKTGPYTGKNIDKLKKGETTVPKIIKEFNPDAKLPSKIKPPKSEVIKPPFKFKRTSARSGANEKLPPNSDYPSNWELSAARSLNLVRIMNKYAAMPEKYFSAMGYGEFRPIIDVGSIRNPEEKRKARAINRRVEIYLDAFLKKKVLSEIKINV